MRNIIKQYGKDMILTIALFTQITLVVLRINEVITISWWFVFLPTLIYPMIIAGIWIAVFFYLLSRRLTEKSRLKRDLKEVTKANKEVKELLKELEDGND